jgi:hypothetical protein
MKRMKPEERKSAIDSHLVRLVFLWTAKHGRKNALAMLRELPGRAKNTFKSVQAEDRERKQNQEEER